MLGGAFLLRRVLTIGDQNAAFQATWLRAFHAHGTVLILMSLLYYTFLDHTSLSISVKRMASAALFTGIVAQSGGFLLHAIFGGPNRASDGTTVTIIGAALLVGAVLVLVYGLITTGSEQSGRSPHA